MPLTTPSSIAAMVTSLLLAVGLTTAVVTAEPAQPRMKLGAYYFAGWSGASPYDDGKPGHEWARGMPTHISKALTTEFAGRTPIWGWRDDTPELTERQINLAADHGLRFFAYCWYFKDDQGPINTQKIEQHPLHTPMKLFMAAKNNARMEFCLLVANHTGSRISGEEAWKQASDYWVENYFKHPRYLRMDGKPIIIIFDPKGADKAGLVYLQDAAKKAGMPGIWVAGCGAGNPDGGFQIRAVYNSKPSKGLGLEELYPYKLIVDHSISTWKNASSSDMPYIPVATQGWDRRPWEAKNGEGLGKGSPVSPHFARGTPQEFEGYLRHMVAWMDANPKNATKDRLGVIYAWNEIGEGGSLVPCRDDPDGAYLKAIKRVVFGK